MMIEMKSTWLDFGNRIYLLVKRQQAVVMYCLTVLNCMVGPAVTLIEGENLASKDVIPCVNGLELQACVCNVVPETKSK